MYVYIAISKTYALHLYINNSRKKLKIFHHICFVSRFVISKNYIDLIERKNLLWFIEMSINDTFHQNGDKLQPTKTDLRFQEPPMNYPSHRQHVRGACLRWYQHRSRPHPIRIGPGGWGAKFMQPLQSQLHHRIIVTIHLQSPWMRRWRRRSTGG